MEFLAGFIACIPVAAAYVYAIRRAIHRAVERENSRHYWRIFSRGL